MQVRAALLEDMDLILDIHREAFGRELEGEIAQRIVADGDAVVSLFAGDRGHILLSEAKLSGGRVLAPGQIGVRPLSQRQGCGGLLVEQAVKEARGLGYDAIVLIGHPSYYPRFGFVPASQLGLKLPYDVPDGVAMALPLNDRCISGDVVFPKGLAGH